MALPALHRREREAVPWSPFAELEQTAKRLSSLLDQTWAAGWPNLGWPALDRFVPLADLEETDDAYVLEVELPGVSKQDVDVEVAGGRLTVSGERTERERTGILRRRARSVGRFRYEVVLPGEVDEDAITASLADGVLTVTAPKPAAERRGARRIEVS